VLVKGVHDLSAAVRGGLDLEPGAATAVANLVQMMNHVGERNGVVILFHPRENPVWTHVWKKIRPYMTPRSYPDVFYGPTDVQEKLQALEEEIAREVLASHVTGYSTSAHDFVDDLIP
jgi:hypothetical protein